MDQQDRRRDVRYETLAEFREDAERLAGADCRSMGQWTAGQVFDHLARSLNGSLDGYGFRANWFLRTLLAPIMKNSFLTRPMKPGFRLPRRAVEMVPDPELSAASGLDRLRDALDRLGAETPTARHPFLGLLTSEEWTALHLRHAELHMSFIWPVEAPPGLAEPQSPAGK